MSKVKSLVIGGVVFLSTWFAVAWLVRRYAPENIKANLRV